MVEASIPYDPNMMPAEATALTRRKPHDQKGNGKFDSQVANHHCKGKTDCRLDFCTMKVI
jgi:hypothetical protein